MRHILVAPNGFAPNADVELKALVAAAGCPKAEAAGAAAGCPNVLVVPPPNAPVPPPNAPKPVAGLAPNALVAFAVFPPPNAPKEWSKWLFFAVIRLYIPNPVPVVVLGVVILPNIGLAAGWACAAGCPKVLVDPKAEHCQ